MKDNQIKSQNIYSMPIDLLSMIETRMRIIMRDHFGQGKKIEVITANQHDWEFVFWDDGNGKKQMAVF